MIPECKKLKNVTFAGCEVDNAVVWALARHCPDLEGLNISGSTQVTDEGIIPLVYACRKLGYLGLAGCIGVGDHGVYSIAMKCPVMVRIATPPDISDVSAIPLVQIPTLESISFDTNTKITDATLDTIIQRARRSDWYVCICVSLINISYI